MWQIRSRLRDGWFQLGSKGKYDISQETCASFEFTCGWYRGKANNEVETLSFCVITPVCLDFRDAFTSEM